MLASLAPAGSRGLLSSMTAPLPAPRIRDEGPGDAEAIAAAISAAFAPEAALPAPEAGLVDDLRAAGALGLSLVAEAPDGTLVGHVAFSPVTVEGRGADRLLGLAPLAVVPAWQGRGLGSALVSAGLEAARARGCELVVVLGEPAYYRRFGFRPAGAFGIAWEHPAPPDAFMAVALAGDGSGLQGVLRYHAAFDRFKE